MTGLPSTSSPASASTWLPLLREALAQEGRFRWTLHGTSMRPTLPTECEIEIVPLPGDVRLGALIVFAAGDALIAHRLVRRAGAQWIAQGDGRLAPDRPLVRTQVLGLVGAAYRNGKRCWPGAWQGLLAAFWVARHWMLRPIRAIRRWLRR